MINIDIFENTVLSLFGFLILLMAFQSIHTIKMYFRKKINYNNFTKEKANYDPQPNRLIIFIFILVLTTTTASVVVLLISNFTLYIYLMWYYPFVLIITAIGVYREVSQPIYSINLSMFEEPFQQIHQMESNIEKHLDSLRDKKDQLKGIHKQYSKTLGEFADYFKSDKKELYRTLEILKPHQNGIENQVNHIHGHISDLISSFNEALTMRIDGTIPEIDINDTLKELTENEETFNVSAIEKDLIKTINKTIEEKLSNGEYASVEKLINLIKALQDSPFSISEPTIYEIVANIESLPNEGRKKIVQTLYTYQYFESESLIEAIVKNSWSWLITWDFKAMITPSQLANLIEQFIFENAFDNALTLLAYIEENDHRSIEQSIINVNEDNKTGKLFKNYLQLVSIEKSFINPSNRAEMYSVILLEHFGEQSSSINQQHTKIKSIVNEGSFDEYEQDISEIYFENADNNAHLLETSLMILVEYTEYVQDEQSYINIDKLRAFLSESLLTLRVHETMVTLYIMMMIILVFRDTSEMREHLSDIVRQLNPDDFGFLKYHGGQRPSADVFYKLLVTDTYHGSYLNIIARIENERLSVDYILELIESSVQ